jgi:hypothetical protein
MLPGDHRSDFASRNPRPRPPLSRVAHCGEVLEPCLCGEFGYLIAEALRARSRAPQTIDDLETYLRLAPDAADADEIREQVENLKKRAVQVH